MRGDGSFAVFFLYAREDVLETETVLFRDVAGVALSVRTCAQDLEAAAALVDRGNEVVDPHTALRETGRVDLIHTGGKIVQVRREDAAATDH